MLDFTVPNLQVTVSVINSDGSIRSTHDVSRALVSVEINHEQQTNLSGCLPWSGRLEINRKCIIPGVSLNPRDMVSSPKGAELWAKGSRVDVYVANSSGTLKRYWPSLYILSQPSGFPNLSCELVDEIGLKTYQQPEGDETNTDLGTIRSRSSIVRSILSSFTGLPVSGSVSGFLKAPIQKVNQSSFAQQAGELAWTSINPRLVWVDNTNTIQLTPFDFDGGSSAFSVNMTTEIAEFEELNADERPNVIRVVGNSNQVTELPELVQSQNVTKYFFTEINVKVSGLPRMVRIERSTKLVNVIASIEEYTEEVATKNTIKERWIPMKEIWGGVPTDDRWKLRKSSIETVAHDWRWDGRPTTDRSLPEYNRLVTKEETTRSRLGLSIIGVNRNDELFDWITSKRVITKYEYAPNGIIEKRITETLAAEITLNPLSYLEENRGFNEQTIEFVVEKWTRYGKQEWRYDRTVKQPRIIVNNEAGLDPDLLFVLVVTESETLTGAPANPPATEYKPNVNQAEEIQHAGETEFQSLSGEALDQIRVISLPGGMAESKSHCRSLARKYGRLLYGRSLAIVGQTEILDWLLNSYQPYSRWDLTDIDGVKTAYWLDGVSIRIEGNKRGYVQIGGAEIGIVDANDYPVPRYQTKDELLITGFHTVYLDDSVDYEIIEDPTLVYGHTIYLEGETVTLSTRTYLEGEAVTTGQIVYLDVPSENDMGIPAYVICGDGTGGIPVCSYAGSGKVLEFSGDGLFYVNVYLDFDYVPTHKTLRVSKWNTTPNAAQTGRIWDQDLDMNFLVGGDFVGQVALTVTSTYQWFDFQEFDTGTGESDAICFRLEGSTLSLMGV